MTQFIMRIQTLFATYSISRKIVNTLSKDDNLKHKEYYSEQILLLEAKNTDSTP